MKKLHKFVWGLLCVSIILGGCSAKKDKDTANSASQSSPASSQADSAAASSSEGLTAENLPKEVHTLYQVFAKKSGVLEEDALLVAPYNGSSSQDQSALLFFKEKEKKHEVLFFPENNPLYVNIGLNQDKQFITLDLSTLDANDVKEILNALAFPVPKELTEKNGEWTFKKGENYITLKNEYAEKGDQSVPANEQGKTKYYLSYDHQVTDTSGMSKEQIQALKDVAEISE